ncbi:UNVERIFIED_CONTAM: hypothetical protein NCL1_36569 [Trichonephila clavipes]
MKLFINSISACNQSHPSTNAVTSKNKDMLDSFTVITSELETLTTNIRITQQTKTLELKGKAEMDAVLHAAQAEAEAAKAAAAAAQQAAKAAEAAAKAIPPKPQQRPPRFVKQLADAEVSEGIKFTFECEVEGEPMPQVNNFLIFIQVYYFFNKKVVEFYIFYIIIL